LRCTDLDPRIPCHAADLISGRVGDPGDIPEGEEIRHHDQEFLELYQFLKRDRKDQSLLQEDSRSADSHRFSGKETLLGYPASTV